MEYRIFSSDSFQPVSWSGGKTTELFIFPPTAEYSQRNFQFRLSTASVETERSDFTLLKGVRRKLMVLEGNITLYHEDHYSKQLNKFGTDEFEGDWITSSIGKCVDFNLMTTGKTTGELKAIVIQKEQCFNFKINEISDWLIIYQYSGQVRIQINNEIATIKKRDLLIFNKPAVRNFEISGIENSELVLSEITLNE